MKSGILWGILILMLAGFAGCMGSSPKSTYYLLGSNGTMVLEHPVGVDLSVGIGPVVIPDHLNRPEIVTRTSENAMDVNEFHRWGAPLTRQVRETLMANLSALLQTPRVVLFPWEGGRRPTYRVDATFLRFERGNATAVMDVLWDIREVEKDQILLTRRFSVVTPITGQDVAAYVAAQTQALEKLGRDIAGGILKCASNGLFPGN